MSLVLLLALYPVFGIAVFLFLPFALGVTVSAFTILVVLVAAVLAGASYWASARGGAPAWACIAVALAVFAVVSMFLPLAIR